jgi:hypothetical protein
MQQNWSWYHQNGIAEHPECVEFRLKQPKSYAEDCRPMMNRSMAQCVEEVLVANLREFYSSTIQIMLPTRPTHTRIVKIAAPALSAVVMGAKVIGL